MSQATAQKNTLPEGQHGVRAHSDGPVVPVQTRSERPKSYDVADFAEVTGREAVWKLSPVAEFADLFAPGLDGGEYPFEIEGDAGITAEWIAREDALIGTAGTPEERASANAWSSFEKALRIRVTGEETQTTRLTRAALGSTARAAHTVIEATPHSNGVIILENRGSARLTENVEIIVGAGAQLTVVTLQEWDEDAVHVASHLARIGRDAKLKHVAVNLGGKVVRVNPSAHLAESGADINALGLYFADAGQHLEQHVYVHHEAPHTVSNVNYKGALQGDGARTVWIGDVLIGRDATGTDSYEQNRNLVLTDGTRADSIPNLEIETGDIAGAGHASATGRFDDEQLFYLQARGISEEEARRLVVLGFLTEIIQQIGVPELQARLENTLEEELADTSLAAIGARA